MRLRWASRTASALFFVACAYLYHLGHDGPLPRWTGIAMLVGLAVVAGLSFAQFNQESRWP